MTSYSDPDNPPPVFMHVGDEPPGPGVVVNILWMDTSFGKNNRVLKYWDGDEWVRMDGGGTIPDDFITERMLAPYLRTRLENDRKVIESCVELLAGYKEEVARLKGEASDDQP